MNELFKIDTIISFKEYLKIKKFYKKTNQIIIFISILIILISILNFIKDFHIIFLIASISVFVIYLDFLIKGSRVRIPREPPFNLLIKPLFKGFFH